MGHFRALLNVASGLQSSAVMAIHTEGRRSNEVALFSLHDFDRTSISLESEMKKMMESNAMDVPVEARSLCHLTPEMRVRQRPFSQSIPSTVYIAVQTS